VASKLIDRRGAYLSAQFFEARNGPGILRLELQSQNIVLTQNRAGGFLLDAESASQLARLLELMSGEAARLG
jgi:hypothetical protein